MSARSDLLRAYVGTLAAEGVFVGTTTPFGAVARAVGAFTTDLKTLGGELAEFAARRGAQTTGDVILGKFADLARSIKERGVTAAFEDAFATYWDGVAARNK